jgi:hypothetical protein
MTPEQAAVMIDLLRKILKELKAARTVRPKQGPGGCG